MRGYGIESFPKHYFSGDPGHSMKGVEIEFSQAHRAVIQMEYQGESLYWHEPWGAVSNRFPASKIYPRRSRDDFYIGKN